MRFSTNPSSPWRYSNAFGVSSRPNSYLTKRSIEDSVIKTAPNQKTEQISLALTIFLGAFLLFFVQPMIARQLLPTFGGAASVWMACLLFFQTSLLLGYCYAHLLRIYCSPKRQILIHCNLVAISIVWTWFSWNSPTLGPKLDIPLVRLMIQLGSTIGVPFVLLAGTSPLVQHWYGLGSERPYRLYALSNLGSLLALLIFPFLIEPNWSNTEQFYAWFAGLGLYLGMCLFILKKFFSFSEQQAAAKVFRAGSRDRIYWTALSACGAIILLSSSSVLTREVGPVPFLWILPLSLYLLTFIICFDKPEWYRRKIFFPLFVASLALLMILYNAHFLFSEKLFTHSLVLFSTCMICHGEMVRLRPDSDQLTEFYLFLSIGGVVGSVFVNVIAPALFSDYYEHQIAILLTLLLASHVAIASVDRFKKTLRTLSIAFAMILIGLFLNANELEDHVKKLAAHRGFYGLLEVLEVEPDTRFTHHKLYSDNIEHGSQLIDDEYRHIPITYFSDKSGVGIALLNFQKPNRRVGVVGLGAGTLAAYGTPGDVFRFYEINPDCLAIANQYFTYLSDSKAEVEVILGDARLSLEEELASGQRFDVLVIDAFNGDSTPSHLLTAEAWDLWWQLLNEDGILAINVSNDYLDLVPVVQHHNRRINRHELVHVFSEDNDSWDINAANWLLETANRRFLDDVKQQVQSPASDKLPVEWTDEKFSLLELFY
jgi:hypothetical protein